MTGSIQEKGDQEENQVVVEEVTVEMKIDVIMENLLKLSKRKMEKITEEKGMIVLILKEGIIVTEMVEEVTVEMKIDVIMENLLKLSKRKMEKITEEEDMIVLVMKKEMKWSEMTEDMQALTMKAELTE